MPEIIYGVHIITDKNKEKLKKSYYHEILLGLKPASFEVGCVIVMRNVHVIDPFDARFKSTLRTYWLVTLEEFESKFVINEDGHRTSEFALITPKDS